MNELGVRHVYQGQEDKIHAYEQLKTNLNLNHDEIAYVGDDLNDLPLVRRCGFGVGVANATPILLKHADWQTQNTGGAGAVREVCELILSAQNQLEIMCEHYL
jgi:3-deoxy-D-manno-octulosonate 8-phosphate phosphatase (KDO 8-P phosphatase)